MNYELTEALAQLVREKSLDKQLVAETLEAGLLSAARKKLGPTADVEAKVDMDAGKIGMCVKKKVTIRVHDPAAEISLADAHKVKKDIKCGETLSVQLSIEEFGRNAIQAVKQVLVQRVREAERERIYKEFQGRIGELVRGTVQQVDRTCIIVKLDRTEGVLLTKETMPRDRFRHGDYVRTCVIGVDKSSKGPQVMLSRTHPDFLKGLFASEVPEVADKIVEIKNVAREAGNRTKICVVSNDEKVDAVGACVGVKGSRVQAVVRELSGERIDIVSWSADPMVFVTRALSPAKVLEARMFEREKKAEVVVNDDQLSLAIGKGGQNARLAAKLTGWKIDLMSLSQKEKLLAEEKALRVDVETIDGIGPKLADKLIKAGIETAQDIEKHGVKGLVEVEGVGQKTADKLAILASQAIADAKEKLMSKRAAAAREEKAAEKPEPAGEAAEKTGVAAESENELVQSVETEVHVDGDALRVSTEEPASGKDAEVEPVAEAEEDEDDDEEGEDEEDKKGDGGDD
ncbi:MAG: transcription termination factor NusA [Candidatus Eisenbacteria bacterium]|nr:transcription termination factor NusA [Candidatus Eisenbacteria bacterium]